MKSELPKLRQVSGKVFSVLAFLTYSGFVFYYSVRPIGKGSPIFTLPGADKFLHAGEFTIFVLLAYRAIHHFVNTRQTNNSAAGLSIFYASLTEFTQGFISYRTSSWLDWLANLAGISLGLGLIILVRKKKNRKNGRE